jgi:hypothetical protein
VANVTVQAVPLRNSYSITSALVYALDRQHGRLLWPCPADVENFSFPEDQPPEAPVLTFLRQRTATNSGGGGRTQAASAVCLDKRDGRVVLWKDDVKGSSISQYELIAQPETQSVSLVLPGKTFTLTFTDQPTPPAPPAHVGSLVPPRSLVDSAGRVAGGILRAITGDAPRRVLKVPIDPFAPEPAKEPAPARRPVNPAPPR